MLCNVVVGRTRPWSNPLAILTIRKELHEFIFLCNTCSSFFAFDKGERLHSAVAFENFGAFIDTDLAPQRIPQGEIIQGKWRNVHRPCAQPRSQAFSLCLLNDVAMCFVSTRSPVSRLPRVLVCFLVQFDLLFTFGVLSCRILDSASLFILYVHDYNRLGFLGC